MRKPTVSENMTVFVLFFGMSILDAFASRVWWRAAFWLAIATVFGVMAWRGERRPARHDAGATSQ